MKLLCKATAVVAIVLMVFASCKKSDNNGGSNPPIITLNPGLGIVSKDTIAQKNSHYLTSIFCKRGSSDDQLSSFSVVRSSDGGAPEVIFNQTLGPPFDDNMGSNVTLTTRNVAGSEKYTFTISTRLGLLSSVSLTLTVQ